ncbi:OPT family oligopeptide transporter [Fictibacillus enclensis]|uniref:OPT family oligopeptide transporter n=1 Tax=Fictibacillus enclensis TaxID=1017270 RepID=UPI0024C06B2E|nr:oligopeptide transporter, OPT family [Fictibacillus enclensis]WHY75015.1 oligopeptide transporter, OPT family [Fictibacillus enclensis]
MDNKQEKSSSFVPYIPSSRSLPELTAVAIIFGIILAIVFGAANAYLGLKVGLTVSASIPAAVISMGVLRGIFRRDSILENNIVQTMTTAGEAIGAGAVFTLPAFFLLDIDLSQTVIIFIVLTGGLLGVFMMVPLRQMLIVKEHGNLPYPEGTACAEVLKSGEKGGANAKTVAIGFLFGGLVKVLGDGFMLFKTEIETQVGKLKNTVVGMDIFPALLGVGYIIGPRIAGQMLAGGLLAWIVLIPAIAFFGADSTTAIFPAEDPIGKLDAWGIWDSYIKYIGAGAVAVAGLITLLKTMPTLISTAAKTMKGLSDGSVGGGIQRTDKDMPFRYVILGVVALVIIIGAAPVTNVGFIGAIAIAIFGFLFVAVASRIVGIVGSSSSPVSGMTIATLLIVTLVYKVTGLTGLDGMKAALTVAAIVCTALAVAGDISQDLKTGHLVGGTPWKQQVAMMIGVIASGLVIGIILIVLDKSYGMGSQQLPAPKAAIMKVLVQGIFGGDLPWSLIFIGAAIAIVIEFLGLNSLVVAVGLYLPVHISAPVMFGGAVRWLVDVTAKTKEERQARADRGVLFASGLIAGESLLGVLIAVLIFFNVSIPETPLTDNRLIPFLIFLFVCWLLYWFSTRTKADKLK